MPDADFFRALERERTQALVDRDVAAIRRLHAPDCELITVPGRVMSLERYLSLVAQGPFYARWEHGEMSVRLAGRPEGANHPLAVLSREHRSMNSPFDPAGYAQRQLDAYNARDLDAFLREYTDDVVAFRLGSGEPLLSGKAAFGEHYRRNRFSLPQLHAELVARMVFGNKVIDQERVHGVTPEVMEVAAIYEVTPPGIRRVWFVDGR